MNKIGKIIKHNLYLSVTLIFLVASIAFAGITLGMLGITSNVDETSVGTIYLGEYDESQYLDVLTRKITAWKSSVDYRMQFQEYVVPLDLDLYVFLASATIDSIEKDKSNPAYFSLSSTNRDSFESSLIDQFTQNIMDNFDYESFYDDLDLNMQKLDVVKIFELSDYLDSELKANEIDTTEITNIPAQDVLQITAKVSSIEILAKSRFSLIQTLQAYNLSNNQLSIIASALQKVTRNTNFTGFVFEQNYTLPAWAVPGINVRILLVNQYDFSFYNNLDYSFTLTIESSDENTLVFSLQGYPYITTYSTASVEHDPIPFQTVYVDNPDIDETTAGVIITETDTDYTYHLLIRDGLEGRIISYMRTTMLLDGEATTVKLYDELYYAVNIIYEENVVDKGGA